MDVAEVESISDITAKGRHLRSAACENDFNVRSGVVELGILK